ncbi:MAG: NAD-dependent epimerase/dehydratase family protein, partial [Bdellovibrionales bacterium]|nr:NAD-dependent epimerase/dehydratase family protein [Bdellovibrionales bacterium]
MLIVLTGGTGLIGKALGQRLTEAGHQVHLLTRRPEKAKNKIPWPCEVFQWNALSNSLPKEAVPEQKEKWGVINLAGESIFHWPWRKSVKKTIYQSRITGTKNLVQSLSQLSHPPDFFINASAIGIYGETEITAEKESPPDSPLFLQTVCKDWEKETLK